MSKTIERIEGNERLFKRMLRNRARRLLLRSREYEMADALGLFEEEDEPCDGRGGMYCMLGLSLQSCSDAYSLCNGSVGGDTVNPIYDALVEKYGDPAREPELPETVDQPEESKPARTSGARKRGVRSKSTVKK